jgi:hypothetical protein
MLGSVGVFSEGRRDWLADAAVYPITGLRIEFPANSEKYREISKKRASTACTNARYADGSGSFSAIPCLPEQGISRGETGKRKLRNRESISVRSAALPTYFS